MVRAFYPFDSSAVARESWRASAPGFLLSGLVHTLGLATMSLVLAENPRQAREPATIGRAAPLSVTWVAAPPRAAVKGAPNHSATETRPAPAGHEPAESPDAAAIDPIDAPTPQVASARAEADTAAVAIGSNAAGTDIPARTAADDPSDYARQLLDRIRPFLHYPDTGTARPEGAPRIGIAIAREGRVLQVWLVGSSGSAELDRSVIAAVWKASPLPQIPAALPAQINVVLPVDFSPARSSGLTFALGR